MKSSAAYLLSPHSPSSGLSPPPESTVNHIVSNALMALEGRGDGSPMGTSEFGDGRLGFDRRVRLDFHGSNIRSDGGLLLFRELVDVLGLHDMMGEHLQDARIDHNRLHSMVGLSRQSTFGWLAGYEDVNDADRLAVDPVMRQIVGGRAVDR